MDVVLGVDFFLLAAPALVGLWYLVFGELEASLPIEVAGAAALAFMGYRAGGHPRRARPPSDNWARRAAGIVLIALGTTLTLIGGVIVVFALMNIDERSEAKHLLLLPLLASPALLGNAVVYAGAAVRAQRRTDGRV